MNPIFIPSKGRPVVGFLLKELLATSLEWYYVVEPQEQAAYAALMPVDRLIVLPDNNKGIAFVRNFILDRCRTSGSPWFWMLDDDITGFYRVEHRRNVRTSITTVLEQAEASIAALSDRFSVGQYALEYQQYAWSSTKKYRVNSYCDVCVAINTAVKAAYREYVNLKEDRDFTLQVITSGFSSVRVCDLAFSAPKNGSNAGGLKPVYGTPDRESTANRRMVELWGNTICKIVVKKNGREDVKIDWSRF
jgi:hypothetical protein